VIQTSYVSWSRTTVSRHHTGLVAGGAFHLDNGGTACIKLFKIIDCASSKGRNVLLFHLVSARDKITLVWVDQLQCQNLFWNALQAESCFCTLLLAQPPLGLLLILEQVISIKPRCFSPGQTTTPWLSGCSAVRNHNLRL